MGPSRYDHPKPCQAGLAAPGLALASARAKASCVKLVALATEYLTSGYKLGVFGNFSKRLCVMSKILWSSRTGY